MLEAEAGGSQKTSVRTRLRNNFLAGLLVVLPIFLGDLFCFYYTLFDLTTNIATKFPKF